MITKEQLRAALPFRRPGVTSDEDWGQLTVLTEYRDLFIKNRVVMDVGGNIGAMAVRCSLEGAAAVHTYEPERSNWEILIKHTFPLKNVYSYNVALSLDPSGSEIDLWLTNERTLGSCSTTQFRGRTPQKISTLNFVEELERIRPQSIKLDCEGAEWELLTVPLPPSVDDVVAELHFTKRYWREENYPEILKWMKEQGFYYVKAPKNTGKNFHTLAHWRR